MATISCFYNRIFTRSPHSFTFIKYEKFVKVFMDSKVVVLTNEDLISDQRLFQIFILSLLLTKDTSIVDSVVDVNDGKVKYGKSTMRHCRYIQLPETYKFTQLLKSSTKNPLNAREPKRPSSSKKIRKFFKSFNTFYWNEMIKETDIIFEEFFYVKTVDIFDYVDRYAESECKVVILSSILHAYGRDVYSAIKRFL